MLAVVWLCDTFISG